MTRLTFELKCCLEAFGVKPVNKVIKQAIQNVLDRLKKKEVKDPDHLNLPKPLKQLQKDIELELRCFGREHIEKTIGMAFKEVENTKLPKSYTLLESLKEELKLSRKLLTSLNFARIYTLEQLPTKTKIDLVKLEGLKNNNIPLIEKALSENGLALKKVENEDDIIPLIFATIEQVPFHTRTYTCLKRAHINTLYDLTQKTEENLLLIRNFGKKQLEHVIFELHKLGLSLKNQVSVPVDTTKPITPKKQKLMERNNEIIRRVVKNKETQTSVAKSFNLSNQTISVIVKKYLREEKMKDIYVKK